jgi:hypothetical protein
MSFEFSSDRTRAPLPQGELADAKDSKAKLKN